MRHENINESNLPASKQHPLSCSKNNTYNQRRFINNILKLIILLLEKCLKQHQSETNGIVHESMEVEACPQLSIA